MSGSSFLQHRNSYSVGTPIPGLTVTSTTANARRPYRLHERSASSLPLPGRYDGAWPLYSVCWHRGEQNSGSFGKLAVGSLLEEPTNKLQVLWTTAVDDDTIGSNIGYTKIAEADVDYPITRLLWEPARQERCSGSLLASSGDRLRLWEMTGEVLSPGRRLGGIRQQWSAPIVRPTMTAPLTSFDWNVLDPSLIVTASVDTTCTVWDLAAQQARTQLIAHDREVYDVAFAAGSLDIFATVGADGSVRMFDLRALEHSTIVYESLSTMGTPKTLQSSTPLLRLAACEQDGNIIATFHHSSNKVQILDIRRPGSAVVVLSGHSANLNAVAWSPNSRNKLATCGDDCQVMVWEVNHATANNDTSGPSSTNHVDHPMLAWTADSETNNLCWGQNKHCSRETVLGVTFGRSLQALVV